jgi:hypothetical protein
MTLTTVLVLFPRAVVLAADPSPASTQAPTEINKPSDKVKEDLARLIRQLGHVKFKERLTASKHLDALGEAALDALRRVAATSTDLEVRQRAGRLVRNIERRLFIRRNPLFSGPQVGERIGDLVCAYLVNGPYRDQKRSLV